MSPRLAVVLARVRIPLIVLSVAPIVGVALLTSVPWWAIALAVLVLFGLISRLGTVRRAPIEVRTPVSGRWRAIRSPAIKVPTHGTHAYGQTYALDLVREPTENSRPGYGWWPLLRHPTEYPAFAAPVLAPADGVVVRVKDGQRDHPCRSSWPAVAYMFLIDGPVRELLGPSRLVGNHVVIRLPGGTYSLHAHLKQGSVSVRTGATVTAGEPIAECGNSGNSSEPHLHFQLMDHPNPLFAAGLPVRFEHFEVEGAARDGVPDDAAFVA